MAKLLEVDGDPFASQAPQAKQAPEAALHAFADAASAALGVPKSTVLAHAKLETGAGGLKTVGDYNFGNIKAGSSWKGPTASVNAKEYDANGKAYNEPSKFRAYESPEQAGQDYADLIKRKYPGAEGAASAEAFAKALKAGGYATDPAYVSKFASVAKNQGGGARLVEVQGDPFAAAPVATSKPTKAEPSAAYKAGTNEAGGATRGLVNVLQGPTLGFADEIGGGLGALIDTVKGKPGTFADKYRDNRDYLRGASDTAAKDNPMLSAVTQGMASAPTMLFSPGATVAAKATGIGGNMLRAGITGGITGAVSGAGSSKAETLGGVANDALIGGATGGALGAAAIPVGSVLGAVGSNVKQRVSQSAAAQAAQEKVAEAIARDAKGATFRAGYQGDPSAQAAAKLGKLGDEARLVDAGGQNTRQLLDTLATLPGRTKEDVERAIHSRQATRGARLIESADKSLGSQGNRLAGTVESLMEQRQQAAAPLYDKLYRQTVPVNPEIQSIVTAAQDLGAGKLGKDIATGKRMPFTLDSAAGKYSMADLDHVKQALDQQIMTKGTDTATGRLNPLGHSLTTLRTDLLTNLDTATAGAYKTARDAFSGPTAIMSAAQAGRNVLSKDDATIRGITNGLSESELQGFRIGAFEALRAKLGRSGGQTELLNMWKEPAVQEKLKAIFPTERAYREFASTIAAEGKLKGLESVGRGSQTAARQYAAGDLDTSALSDIGKAGASAAHGNLLGMVSGAKAAWNKVQTPEATRDAMGNLLLSGGPGARQNMLDLSETVKLINNAKARNAARTGVAAGVGVNALMPR